MLCRSQMFFSARDTVPCGRDQLLRIIPKNHRDHSAVDRTGLRNCVVGAEFRPGARGVCERTSPGARGVCERTSPGAARLSARHGRGSGRALGGRTRGVRQGLSARPSTPRAAEPGDGSGGDGSFGIKENNFVDSLNIKNLFNFVFK